MKMSAIQNLGLIKLKLTLYANFGKLVWPNNTIMKLVRPNHTSPIYEFSNSIYTV